MRVLHTLASLDPATGGPARSVPALVRALKQAGIDPVLWTARPSEGEWTQAIKEAGVPVHSGELAALGRFDLIHDHGLWLPNNHAVARLARVAKTPRIVSPRGMLEPWALNHRKWKKRLAWWLYQRADLHAAAALHATAESEAEHIKELGLRIPVYVIPNGVELPRAASESPEVESQRSENPRTALFLSRIHPKKGLRMLIEAWAAVRPAGWRMRVVGPDENGHRAELEQRVTQAGLTGCWEFCDALEGTAKDAAFRHADLFILPTHSENFGIAVAEALAAGVPVITTTGAPWEGLLETNSGWWVDPTPHDLAAALRDACTRDAATLQEMGGRGREWMRRDFSCEGVGTKMAESYQNILGERH